MGYAIYCNSCQYIRDGLSLHIVLGSITSDGVLIIKRAHNQITKISFNYPMSLYCDCGYQAIINPSFKLSDYEQQTI